MQKIRKIHIENEGTLKAYVTYTLETTKNNKTTKVVRRFNDFAWLQNKLEEVYLNVLVPPIPEKDALFRFDPDVIGYRKRELNRFLGRLTRNPIFMNEKATEVFLYGTEKDMSAIMTEVDPTQGGFFASMVLSVTGLAKELTTDMPLTVPVEEDWFAIQENYLQDAGDYFNYVKRCVNANVQLKKEKQLSQISVVNQIQSDDWQDIVNKNDDHDSIYYDKFAEVLGQIVDLNQKMIVNETEMFEDAAMDQHRLAFAARRLILNRQNAKLKYRVSKNNISKNYTGRALEEKKNEEKKKFKETSETVKSQVEQYEKEKFIVCRDALRELARENIEYGQQTIALWKELRATLK